MFKGNPRSTGFVPHFLNNFKNKVCLVEIEVSFILETLTFFKVNCHVIDLSVGFVGKIAEVDD